MIVVDHVTKYYGSTAAVRDLDFKIEEGECVGFLGLNGAGKTTTLRLLSCLLLPTSGRITIRGIDAEEDPHEIRKLIGFLPDMPPLYGEMSVGEFLRFAGQLRRMSKSAVEKRLPAVFDTCGLAEVSDQSINTLSHGYKQRVGIAQAIVHEPDLLILDEPIQGLDPVQIVEMREMIKKLRGNHTILLSTHILSEVEQTCDRVLVLHQGEITAKKTSVELGAEAGVVIEIEVEVSGSSSPLSSAISTISGVVKVEQLSATDSRVAAHITASRDCRVEVAKALVEHGFGLLRLQRATAGLERLFVTLSRGGDA